MKINFDERVERRNTNSFKWDANKQFYGREDVIPLWVADMDFKCAPEILKAFEERLKHGILGYTYRQQGYYDAIKFWFKTRHDWDLDQEKLAFAPPGVIYAINILIDLLTNEGDKIIVQTPIYDALHNSVVLSKRLIVENPLKLVDNKYEIDFENFESLLDDKVKVLIFCNPHNPTGRVWCHEELKKITDICLKNNIFIITDDIHCDMVYKNNKYIPIPSISKSVANNSVLCTSTNKTFNLGGLQLSTLYIENDELRNKFNDVMLRYQTRLDNTFGAIAVETAYTKCGYWVDEVISYIEENRNYLIKFCREKLPNLKIIDAEGTYFAWIDFSSINLGDKLNDFIVNKAKVSLTEGAEFSQNCHEFMRINLACRRDTLTMAIEKIYEEIKKLDVN